MREIVGVARRVLVVGGWAPLLVFVVHVFATEVVWEFLEFAVDAVTGSNLQVSLANTMQDQALGMLGAGALIVARARRERAAPTGHEDPAMKAAARIRAE